MTPVFCPICTRSTLEAILQQVRIQAQIDGDRIVGGVLAYKCTEFGQVFFVRTAVRTQRSALLNRAACRKVSFRRDL